MPLEIAIPKGLRKLMRFGSGVGIEIGSKDLEVVVARVRPASVRVLGRLTIRGFAERPAAEWGAEYAAFLKSAGASHLSATALLPRREVIVRQVALPGVAGKDMDGAIRLQLDSLHPYGEDEVAWGWSPAGQGAAMVGIARRSTVDRYAQLFAEAGVLASSFTFTAAALHAAIRLNGAARDAGFVALGYAAPGVVEVYGESPARAIFSAQFEMAAERAAALALSELRLAPGAIPLKIEEALPESTLAPGANPAEDGLSRNALAYATALAGACPRLAPAANVLPPEYRGFSSRAAFVPTLALAVLLAAVLGGAAAWSRMTERRYLAQVRAEIAKLQPQQQRAAALGRNAEHARARTQWLDRYRAHTRQDLDMLSDLTRMIEPPAWTNTIGITRDSVRLDGEAPQAAALWKILDGSRLFKNSKLESTQPAGAAGERYIISAAREAGK